MKNTSFLITGVGSLPHHNVDAALTHAFQFDVPFLPQIPIRHHREYMISQALDGMPGLMVAEDGAVELDLVVWRSGYAQLNQDLESAFLSGRFDAFEPASAAMSCWQPFVWEVSEKKVPQAKMQIAGPLTCQWALTLSDGSKVSNYPEIGAQIVRLITARALAMALRIKQAGCQPILFIDEPGLFTFVPTDPRHSAASRDLRLLIAVLKKNGVLTGLHCCSNTDWSLLLDLGLNYLSFDVKLSLDRILEHASDIAAFVESGGCFSLGVVPTNIGAECFLTDSQIEQDANRLAARIDGVFHKKPLVTKQILNNCLLTPACGLALKTVGEAEGILAVLKSYQRIFRAIQR